MFSPSVDVGEDLRQYARVKEEEMQARVAEYRKAKEQELVNELGQRIKEFEMKELLLENPHLLDTEPKFIREIKNLSDKLRKHLEASRHSTNVTFEPSPYSIKETEYLFALFDAELDDFRFKIECQLSNYLKVVKERSLQIDSIGEAHFEELKGIVEENLARPIEDVLRALKESAVNAKESIEQRRLEVSKQVRATLENTLHVELAKLAEDVSKDTQSFYRDLEKELMRRRRRLLLTLEKRIIDLSEGFDVKQCTEVREAEADYADEVTNLFLRYVGTFRLDADIPDDGSRIVSRTLDSLDMSHAARVRFILQFVKNFGDEQLFACIAQACGDVSDSISFRS